MRKDEERRSHQDAEEMRRNAEALPGSYMEASPMTSPADPQPEILTQRGSN